MLGTTAAAGIGWLIYQYTRGPTEEQVVEEKYEEILYEEILKGLTAKKEKLDPIISQIENWLKGELKSLQTDNESLKRRIGQLISLIETNGKYENKNLYRDAIGALKAGKNNSFAEAVKNGKCNSLDDFIEGIKAAYQWKIAAPYFQYSFRGRDHQYLGAYSPSDGTLGLSEGIAFDSLPMLCIVIHEMIHVAQWADTNYGNPRQRENCRINAVSANEKPEQGIIIIDQELEAYQVSLEIINLITRGKLEQFVKNHPEMGKTKKIDSEKLTIGGKKMLEDIFKNCSVDVASSFLNYAFDYFGATPRYPNGSNALVKRILEKDYTGIPVTTAELTVSPQEFQRILQKK